MTKHEERERELLDQLITEMAANQLALWQRIDKLEKKSSKKKCCRRSKK